MKGKLFTALSSGSVQCIACNRRCAIPPGKTGYCKMRKNIDGELHLLCTKPSAIAIDPIEKKPLYHFLPSTDTLSIGTLGCNFECKFCQNYQISQMAKDHADRLEYETKKLKDCTPSTAISLAKKYKCPSISYTYNEPTIFAEYAHSIGTLAKQNNIKNVFVTNGYQTNECWDYLSEFVDAANIDLKGDNQFYGNICGNVNGNKVLESIAYAKSKGIWIELTTLIIPGHNDSDDFIQSTGDFIHSLDSKIPWHLSAFHPMYKMRDVNTTSSDLLEHARNICTNKVEHIYIGNVTQTPFENTYCPKCKQLLIRRDGYTILENKLLTTNCCSCGYKISGIFN